MAESGDRNNLTIRTESWPTNCAIFIRISLDMWHAWHVTRVTFNALRVCRNQVTYLTLRGDRCQVDAVHNVVQSRVEVREDDAATQRAARGLIERRGHEISIHNAVPILQQLQRFFFQISQLSFIDSLEQQFSEFNPPQWQNIFLKCHRVVHCQSCFSAQLISNSFCANSVSKQIALLKLSVSIFAIYGN